MTPPDDERPEDERADEGRDDRDSTRPPADQERLDERLAAELDEERRRHGVREKARGSDDRERGHRRGPLSQEVATRWDPGNLMKVVSSKAGRGEPLDATTRARYEARLGVDLGEVRIYSGEFAENVTRAHAAEAVTVGGTGMVLMGNSPDRSPHTAAGQALLAHELTHVAQATRGGGGPAGMHRSQAAGERVLATEEHEAEAEKVEAEVLAGSPLPGQRPLTRRERERMEEDIHEHLKERVLEMLMEEERGLGSRSAG